jgi:hypothetical protein
MQLNLPILHLLENSRNILIAGAGGGFDVFAGLPLYFTLRDAGKTVHLANYSFTDLNLTSRVSEVEPLVDGLVLATHGKVRVPLNYLPEPYLAQWFHEVRGEAVPVWMFEGVGALPLAEAYKALVAHLHIDALILVDGGVDSIMRGDEAGAGTMVEDTISLAAVDALDLPVKLLACIGFGTEVEEAVCHYNALENMAGLVKAGGFVGSCALTPQMDAFRLFEAACRYVWEQPNHHQSHISTRIVPAVQGEFGNHHLYAYHRQRATVCISPLMSLYWFFDARTVIARNLLLKAVSTTRTKDDAFRLVMQLVQQTTLRPRRPLPY